MEEGREHFAGAIRMRNLYDGWTMEAGTRSSR